MTSWWRRPRVRQAARYGLTWFIVAVPLSIVFFFNSSTVVPVASHDTVVSPTTDRFVTVHTGPYLPDLRMPSDSFIGVDLQLGKTEAATPEAMVERYAFIASQPDAQIDHVKDALFQLALTSAGQAALVALLPPMLWLLIGRERRYQLLGGTFLKRMITGWSAAFAVVALVVVLGVRPWADDTAIQARNVDWQTLPEFLPTLNVPSEAARVEVAVTATSTGSRKLLMSAVDTYDRSKNFYKAAVAAAEDVVVREKQEGETVAVIVSDRHDNIGMDKVIRTVADNAGATAVLDLGDDTSTGEAWEAFSLDSLDSAFKDYDRYAVQGNHDHGTFVGTYLEQRGWKGAEHDAFDGPGGMRMIARNDPRSSGLGTWRDAVEQTVGDVSASIGNVACAEEERVNLVMVHDDDMGSDALARGCADLVIAGHVHVQTGPDEITGINGRVGYTYTNGTSGERRTPSRWGAS
ncbi:metallophosphoesterase family protein [Nocardioides alcanivorans]|uniref:metallophosphoesterase family protein n=1 Tax=Nocardioides alcanivorans TaxID=2897352 RepID=UPI001F34C8C3|nr:metallophosphoesterase family protein [Nocardioides alcanivorans]